jgi:hypothetical protein
MAPRHKPLKDLSYAEGESDAPETPQQLMLIVPRYSLDELSRPECDREGHSLDTDDDNRKLCEWPDEGSARLSELTDTFACVHVISPWLCCLLL